MSASLYIVPKPVATRALPDSLRCLFAKRFLDSDGSVSGSFTLDSSNCGYLEGILDCVSDKDTRTSILMLKDIISRDGSVTLQIRR
jgi:hypothetical protein